MSQPAPTDPLTLAIVNARVWTGNPRRPWADAVAIRGNRIALVGSSAAVRKMTAPETRIVDARGHAVMARAPHGESGPTSLDAGAFANLVVLRDGIAPSDASVVRDEDTVLTVIAGRIVADSL